MSKPALGKGLGALIPEFAPSPGRQAEGVRLLGLDEIHPNVYQPRRIFDDERLKELADSIRERGVIQPVLITRRPEGGYMLIAGERRWRAARLAGLAEIPAIVKESSPADRLEIALIENIQREDLNPIETAEAYQRLVREFRLTQEEVSARVGKPRATVANFLRVLSLPPEIKQEMASGQVSMGHAKAILSLDKKADQLLLLRAIVRRGLSVREAEEMARRMGKEKPSAVRPPVRKAGEVHTSQLEDRLRRALGAKVRVQSRGAGGTIEITYASRSELDRLVDLLLD
ncbi:MAG: ParB/RepB/Spo0J family partition protein [Nitrospirae bacterium]|nr:ParB/RepB/Spo0J family partition protein [Nitrospirota bacterium]